MTGVAAVADLMDGDVNVSGAILDDYERWRLLGLMVALPPQALSIRLGGAHAFFAEIVPTKMISSTSGKVQKQANRNLK